jgi:hypothetical protein
MGFHVRFGSEADIHRRLSDVRFAPESGHWPTQYYEYAPEIAKKSGPKNSSAHFLKNPRTLIETSGKPHSRTGST